MDKSSLKDEMDKWHVHFYNGQRFWSFLHHSSLFGSIVCSVVAGALIQLNPSSADGHHAVSAILSSVAAALTSLALAGGFDRKWKSNRLSRSRIDGLLLDLDAEKPDFAELTVQLKEIIMKHDNEILDSEYHPRVTRNHKIS